MSPRRESLFRRASRYRPSSVNPHENRLTEIFAAVLEREECNGLAQDLVGGWLADSDVRPESVLGELLGDSETRWTVAVETQRSFFDGERSWRPDLRLTFTRRDGRARCAVWVEVKHGAELGPGQLEAYSKRLREDWDENGRVVLLAPRAQYPFGAGQIPPKVVQVTWESTGELLERYETGDPVAGFLVTQLIAYLDEEELMNPRDLTQDQLDALKNYESGRRTLEVICDEAGKKVNELWNEECASSRYTAAQGSWWNYPQQARDGKTVKSARDFLPCWELLLSGPFWQEVRPGNVPVFIAGMSGERGRLGAGVREALEDSEFEIWPFDSLRQSDHTYVVHVREVEALLKPGPIDEQATRLATWVNDAFRAIVRALNTV